jgi:AraC-like DNA-binding protein
VSVHEQAGSPSPDQVLPMGVVRYSFSRRSGLGPLPRLFEADLGSPALRRLLASEDIPREGIDPGTPIPFASLNELFNKATRLTGEPLFPLRVAAAMRPEDFGPLVAYALSASTLLAAIRRMNRYVALQTNAVRLALTDDGATGSWGLGYVDARSLRVENHAIHVILPMIAFVRRYAGDFMHDAVVELPSGASMASRLVEEFIGLPVRGNREGFRIVFPSAWLDFRRPSDEPTQLISYQSMISYYRAIPALPKTMAETVVALLAPLLGETKLEIDMIAEKLGVSRRTLQLWLDAEGTTFRDVALGLRIGKAQRLLHEGRDPIAQVALAVGYSDQANFTRAFRHLTGATPAEFRRDSRRGFGTVDGRPLA